MKTVSVLHPSHARGRTTRRRFSVLAVVVAIVGSLFAGVTAASAATTGAVGAGISIYPAGYGEVWLGGHTPPAGGDAVLYCTQARVYTSAGDVPLGTSYMADDPALAWVISAYGNSGDNDTQAAIAYLVHMRHEIPGSMAGGNVATVKQLISDATPAAVKSLAADFIATGASQGGPYTASTGSVDMTTKRAGTIKDIGVTSDSGNWVAGNPFTVTLNGPAVFDATGTNTVTGTTASTGITLAWTATGSGAVTATVKVQGLARYTLTSYDMGAGRQGGLSYGNRNPVFDPTDTTAVSPPFDVAKDFQPEVSTSVATKFVAKGAPLVDQVTAAAAAGDTWSDVGGAPVPVTAVGTLYGPFDAQPAESAAVPGGAPVVGTETMVFTGPGTQFSPGNLRVPGSGFYTWVWRVEKAAQPAVWADYVRGDFADAFARVAETSIVPFQPQVTTRRVDREVALGAPLVDEVTASATDGDVWLHDQGGALIPVTATGVLYGPLNAPAATAATVPAGAPVAGTSTLTFTGPGTQRTPGVTASSSGFYTWVWTIARSAQPVAVQPYLSGDFTDAYLLEAETSTVRHPVTVTTMTRDFTVGQGGRAMDRVTVSGFPDDHPTFTGQGGWGKDTATLTHTVYGPFAIPPTGTTDLSTAPVLASTTTPAKNGDWLIGTAGEFTPTVPGYYVFITRFAGDDRVLPLATSPGDALELFFVPEPLAPPVPVWVTTQATDAVVAGQPMRDVATVTGTVQPGSYLVFAAFGPFDTDQVPADDKPLWTSEQIPVPEVGTYASGWTTTTLTGHVFWVATLYDRDGTVLSRGTLGAASEVTDVTPPVPVVVTTLATPMVERGDAATDTAYVSGPVTPGSTISFALYRQKGDVASDADELVAAAPAITIYHGGEYQSGPVKATKVGIYYWVETLAGPDGTVVHTGGRGLPDETTYVLDVSSKAMARVTAGSGAADTAIFDGPVTPGSTVGFAAYRQDGAKASESDVRVGLVAPVLVEGAGSVASEPLTLPEVGTYYWVETLYDPHGVVVHTGGRGLATETTRAVAGSATGAAGGDGAGAAEALATTGADVLSAATWALLAIAAGTAGVLTRFKKRRRYGAATTTTSKEI